VDEIPPRLRLAARRVQDPVEGRRIVVEAACPTEDCVATASARLSLPGAAKVYRIRSSARQIAKGGKVRLTFRVKRRLRNALRRAFERRARLRLKVAVTAKDAAGNVSVAHRAVTLKH
jgi:hypothetical protein